MAGCKMRILQQEQNQDLMPIVVTLMKHML
jgi:hypothetical protein